MATAALCAALLDYLITNFCKHVLKTHTIQT